MNMSISLQKGQKISLVKENENLSNITVGLGWDEVRREKKAKKGLFAAILGDNGQIDCDASVIMLKDGKLNDFSKDIIYFGNLKYQSGAIKHAGDNRTGKGDGDDEQILVNLSKVPGDYDRLVFVVNIYRAKERSQNFGMIENAFIRVVDNHGKEICRYNLTDDYSECTAMVFAEIYRRNGEWKFNAIGQGTVDNTILELAKRYN